MVGEGRGLGGNVARVFRFSSTKEVWSWHWQMQKATPITISEYRNGDMNSGSAKVVGKFPYPFSWPSTGASDLVDPAKDRPNYAA